MHVAIAKRYERLERCNLSVSLQAIVWLQCKNDIITFIEDWAWTYDPRVKPPALPFLLFPRQKEYLLWRISCRNSEQNGLTEKSRDMGVTWLNVCHQVHCWLFEEGFKGAFGSRKQDLVDKIGDPDSIFEKIRFLLRYLPRWMLPKGFNWDTHDNFMKLINPENGSTITGEAGDNLGRGGRSTFYDLDEAAFVSRPVKVDAALSNNTNIIFYTSSANGISNLFYKKRMTYPKECVFRFHWRDDPRKDDEWYARQKAKFDPVIVASEIDIDYGASIEGIFIPAAWVQTAINLNLPSSGDLIAGLDVATTGKNSSVFTVRKGPKVFSPQSWQGLNTTQSAYKVRDLMIEKSIPHLNFDVDAVGEGVSGTLASIPDLEFTFTPIRGASSPSDRLWDGESRTSAEKFANKRAELWGIMRERFRKTFDHVNGITTHPLDELISIPNEPTLIAQLSQPLGRKTHNGKTLIESKEDMAKRGVKSPDFADSLAYTFEEPPDFDFEIGEEREIYNVISNY